MGKPLLRRLQVPTALTDESPLHVFRPRERTNRVQLRRKRENDQQSFDKMRQLRRNLDTARCLLEWVLRREKRRREETLCELDEQVLRVRLRHEPRSTHAALEEETRRSHDAGGDALVVAVRK